jgi:hypothetical protein
MALRPEIENSIIFYNNQVNFNCVNTSIQGYFFKFVQTVALSNILLILRINAL